MAIAEPIRAATSTEVKTLIDNAVEVRYDAIMGALDKRGRWSEDVRRALNLSDIVMGSDGRINLSRPEKSVAVWLGLTSFFLSTRDQDMSSLVEMIDELIDSTKRAGIFPSNTISQVLRIGVRSRQLIPLDYGIEVAVQKVSSAWVKPTESALSALGGTLIDISAPLNFADGASKFNTHVGPMESLQSVQYFERSEDQKIPDVALYVDVDYYQEPKTSIPLDEVRGMIHSFASKVDSKTTNITNALR